jgi:DNA replication protein DnaC
MKSTKSIINSLINEKVLRTEICDKCDEEFNVVELWFNGEKKATIDYCRECDRREREEELQERVRKDYEKHLRRKYDWLSVIPFETKNATFGNFYPKNDSQEKALKVTDLFVKEEINQTTLFFQGDTGLGKTHLSHAVYQKFIERLQSSIFIDFPSLLAEIRGTYSKDSNHSQERIMNSIKECELLVLDDIGAEYVKPDANGYESWAADILFQIANARQGKKNIYTTNFTSKHLTKKYGMMSKRIISRLMSNAKVIKVEGEDHRLKGLE